VTELVNYIKRFKPTKIAIEASPEWKATEKLRAYKKGAYRLERDERYQLALRIANEINLDTVYAIDDDSMVSDITALNPEYTKKIFKDYDYKSDEIYSEKYKKWYNYEDKVRQQMRLLDYFKFTNSRAYHQAGHGAYLIGDFKLDNKRGPDALAINWYSRNLRIFRNLQLITESPNDRILVIFGNGHGAILRQQLESSPEYQFVEFNNLK
jgi:plasmid maintenance system killer protein